MTFEEILEGITRHRANPVDFGVKPTDASNNVREMRRKIDEIEWALQAIAETCLERVPLRDDGEKK